jgi:hypothetical protein
MVHGEEEGKISSTLLPCPHRGASGGGAINVITLYYGSWKVRTRSPGLLPIVGKSILCAPSFDLSNMESDSLLD